MYYLVSIYEVHENTIISPDADGISRDICREWESHRLCEHIHRHEQLRNHQSWCAVSERNDVRDSVQRDGIRDEQIRQGQPLVVGTI